MPNHNGWMRTLLTTGEYLTMVELFFRSSQSGTDRIIVPMKLTKGIYAPSFFKQIVGRSSEGRGHGPPSAHLLPVNL